MEGLVLSISRIFVFFYWVLSHKDVRVSETAVIPVNSVITLVRRGDEREENR